MNKLNMITSTAKVTIGIDLGDVRSRLHVLDTSSGETLTDLELGNSREVFLEFLRFFDTPSNVTVAMEAGTHSPWLSDTLSSHGYDVLVGNTRKLRAIWDTPNKNDVRDAEMLARIARFDRELLSPIQHRSRTAQMDLAVVKARESLVDCRTKLVNSVRGLVKASGERLPTCSTEAFAKTAAPEIPEELRPAVSELINTIAYLSRKIRCYDKKIAQLCQDRYPETESLQQIRGVGPITSLTFVLTLEKPERFAKSRDVGPFLGLVPKRDQSGECDKPLSITKSGNVYLRRLLVNASAYIMGPFGPDCDLRRHGERIAERGGKVARRKARVAVARKLAVLLHHLWKSGDVYHPVLKDAMKSSKVA